MSADTAFDFYEVVTISSIDPQLQDIVGNEGVVLGRAESSDGSWTYAIKVSNVKEVWMVPHDALGATGRKLSREDFYDGSSLKVSVDPKTGEGRIVDDV
jgi:hypothetical protein